ncbi:MAG: cytochrome c biogenesis protein CcsA [Deltaproteobacteria bacterium]|nr:cytochrome c biogenesis protein CcsA [Deltaproteobacteria bacterium]
MLSLNSKKLSIVENVLFALTFGLVLYANYLVFLVVPNEKVMGPVQRIFYFHVGAAMATYFAIGVILLSSLAYLATRKKFMDQLLTSATEVAFAFCCIVMITGMIWGNAAWNTPFRWEPRLVSFLVLLLILLGMLLLRAFGDKEKVAIHSAVLGIISAINVPIVVFSIKLLPKATQIHPQVVQDRGLRDPSFVYTMLIGMIAMICFQFLLLWVRTKIETVKQQDR